jgi:hypothetical protein
MKLNDREVVDVVVGGVDSGDFPDFCDAYFDLAYYEDGTPLADHELDELGNLYPEVVNQMAFESLI